MGIVGLGSAAAWRWRKLAQTNSLPTGIVSGNGRIESIQVDVAAKYGGRIKEILAREGDLVEEGQVLVKMDTDEMEADLAKVKAKLAESEEAAAQVKTEITKDESQLKLAVVEFKRSRSLLDRKVIAQEEYDRYRTRLDTAKASLDGSKAKLKTANQSIRAAAAEVKRTEVKIDDATLKSPVKGQVLYRLSEPAEVVPFGGKILTLVNLGDVYMELFLPAQEAARVKIVADARIVLDARLEYAAHAKVTYVSPEAQFTPKQVETRSERDKLMFRIKLQVPPKLVLPYIERIKTGVRCMDYVRLDDTAPEQRNFPPKPCPRVFPMPTLNRPVASITDLTHRYRKTLALDSVAAEIPSDCMVGMIVPDDVGNSTLMRIIAGAKKIQARKVHVLGGNIADRRHRNAGCPLIADMPQGLGKNLYFEPSVLENIDFFAQLFGLSRAERRQRIDGLLKATGARPFPEPTGLEAFGWHEAEGRALLVSDTRPGPSHSRRAHDGCRAALSSAILDACSTTSAPKGRG